jgi:toxin HigB-1
MHTHLVTFRVVGRTPFDAEAYQAAYGRPNGVPQAFKHRGRKGLYDGRTARRVAPAHVEKLRDILAVLDRSRGPNDMNVPGFHLHPLKGSLSGYWLYRSPGIGVLRSASITAMPLMSTIWIIISEAKVHGYA